MPDGESMSVAEMVNVANILQVRGAAIAEAGALAVVVDTPQLD
jgi:hypothetical protein